MTTRIGLRTACLILGTVAGCAHTASKAPAASAAPTSELEASAQSIALEVAGVRGLPLKSPLVVKVVDNEAFNGALHKKTEKTLTTQSLAPDRAVWIAFGFAQPDLGLKKVVGEVLDEQILGFYDDATRVLYVRRDMPIAGPAGKLTLAHEIEHALQDQHFGFGQFHSASDTDTFQAHKSLYEGEATLVSVAYLAHSTGQPVAPAIAKTALTLRSLPPEALLQITGHSTAILGAPAILRQAMIFPYVAGMELLSVMYRTGGFALVDRMFAHPPNSTEQVLHPEKYVAGEPPIPVTPPTTPAGYRRIVHGSMGEAGVLALLEQCLPLPQAQRGATGWGGDHFAVLEAPDKSLALLWSTVWDEELQAARFEQALALNTKCWTAAPAATAPLAAEWGIRHIDVVRRQGANVALVRGLPPAAANALLGGLLELPRAKLASLPPLGPITIAAEEKVVDPLLARRGKVVGRVYTNERLRLTAEIPEGFETKTDHPQADLVLLKAPASGVFAFVAAAPTPTTQEQFFGPLAASYAATVGGGRKMVLESSGDVDLGWTRGAERVWKLSDSPLRVRGLLLSACAGKASYGIVQSSNDAATQAVLERWIASFKSLGSGPSPACQELAAAAAAKTPAK